MYMYVHGVFAKSLRSIVVFRDKRFYDLLRYPKDIGWPYGLANIRFLPYSNYLSFVYLSALNN